MRTMTTAQLEETMDALQESRATGPWEGVTREYAAATGEEFTPALFLRNWFFADHFTTLIFSNGHFVTLYNGEPDGDTWDITPLGWGEGAPSRELQDLDADSWKLGITGNGDGTVSVRVFDSATDDYMEARVPLAALREAVAGVDA